MLYKYCKKICKFVNFSKLKQNYIRHWANNMRLF